MVPLSNIDSIREALKAIDDALRECSFGYANTEARQTIRNSSVANHAGNSACELRIEEFQNPVRRILHATQAELDRRSGVSKGQLAKCFQQPLNRSDSDHLALRGGTVSTSTARAKHFPATSVSYSMKCQERERLARIYQQTHDATVAQRTLAYVRTSFSSMHIYAITYPNGKTYEGKDLTGSVSYLARYAAHISGNRFCLI